MKKTLPKSFLQLFVEACIKEMRPIECKDIAEYDKIMTICEKHGVSASGNRKDLTIKINKL